MQVFALIVAMAMLATTSCLVNPSSNEKKLHQVHGGRLTAEQLRKHRDKSVKTAKDIIYDACGTMLHKGSWSETGNGKGFFVFQTKRKLFFSSGTKCTMQYVTIGLQAVYHIGRHGISCSSSIEGHLQINVPSRNSKDESVKITCDARLIDLYLSDDGMRISTFNDTGNAYTAVVDHEGYLAHTVGNVVAGVSPQKAAQFSSKITAAKMARALEENPEKLIIIDNGTVITGALANIIASEAGAAKIDGTNALELLNTVSREKSFISTDTALILTLRAFIWSQHKKSNDDYIQAVPVLRAVLHAHLKSTTSSSNQGGMQ